MIDLFTPHLPYKLSEQLTIEYNRRMSDINHFVFGTYDYYSPLKQDIETIKLLLAMSIFYKRVLTNFNSAVLFSSRINIVGGGTSIQLGTYELSTVVLNRMERTVIIFRKLMSKYSISVELFEYLETKEFLKNVRVYRDRLDRESNKDSNNG